MSNNKLGELVSDWVPPEQPSSIELIGRFALLTRLYHRLYHFTVAQSRFVIDDIRLGSFSKKFHALWHLSRPGFPK